MKIYHADHGITPDVLVWAINQINPTGFFLRTLELPEEFPDLSNALYGPSCGDPPVSESDVTYVRRSEDRPVSRMVDRPKRPTRLLTVIGNADTSGERVIYTAYGGPAAEREPGDVTFASPEEAATTAEFWSTHALASL